MTLSSKMAPKIKKQLKEKAHHLHPVIIVGQHGVTPAVVAETDNALKTHELIKVKINGADREERAAMAQTLSSGTEAEIVQAIGNMVVLYRKNPE